MCFVPVTAISVCAISERLRLAVTMRYYVYLIAFFISIVLAIVGGIAFRFLEVDYEAEVAKEVHEQLKQFLGQYDVFRSQRSMRGYYKSEYYNGRY